MENKLNCIIIHGCPTDKAKAMNPETRTYDKHWIPWVKRELISRGIKTETPLMPNPWRPIYSDFKKEFEKYEVNENTVLIGNSCGCSFLVRWLGESKQKIKKLILVAPWKIPQEERNGDDIDFYAYPIDETIKSRIDEIIMFTSNNEAEDGKKGLIMYHDSLGGKIINLENHGHYLLQHMGTEEFPELLEEIIN
jgi:predicted alpha/beta hydrolase family esterase